MSSDTRRKILKTGLIICLICLVTAVVMIIVSLPGSHGRTVMILSAIVGSLTSLSFFLQLRQK